VLRTGGTQALTASDIANGAITGTQTIVINPAAASRLVVTGFPSSAVVGGIITFTVTLQDAFGNTVPSYQGTVHFSSTDRRAIVPDDYTFGAGDNGSHTFAAVFYTRGSRTITIQDTLQSSLTASLEIEVRRSRFSPP